MRFNVRELRKAKADKRTIFEWLFKQSPGGAAAWLAAYDRMIERVANHAESFANAQESAELHMDVKEAFFKTSRGRVYRALFVIEADNAFILRVRGPGQAPIDATDIEFP